jgi:hypothetical protein
VTNHRFARIFVLLVAAAAACGGASSAAKTEPLRYHFKEQYLAEVPARARAEMQAAQAEYRRALEENRKVESDLASSKRDLQAAEAEASRAHRQKDAADRAGSSAEKSGDWQKTNLAKRDQRVAELTARAADQKVDMVKARRSWLEEYVKFTRENAFAAEAGYELAKAKLARANNIAPPDFAYQVYVDQYELRRGKADKLKGPADGRKETFLEEKKDYQAKRREENEARGIDTAAKSPESDESQ